MFMGCAAAELRRQVGRTFTTAAGRGVGVALGMEVVDASAGLDRVQDTAPGAMCWLHR